MHGLALILALAADAGVAPRDEVLTLVQKQVAAWNRGDLDGFCAVYADDAVFVTPPRAAQADAGVSASDGVTRGRAEVLARYKKRYPDGKAMGQLAIEPWDVRETRDTVSISAKWTLRYPDKPALSGNTVIVLLRGAGGWRIVHDASM
ncbi:MAG: nuclear transport factor 2 family protein [Myxococcaceae bacterium]|nr:nuclear transport factor 2 family protein [Myxococcaceae bacterium]